MITEDADTTAPAAAVGRYFDHPGLAFCRHRIIAEEIARIVETHRPDTTKDIVLFFLGGRKVPAPHGFLTEKDGDDIVVLVCAGCA